MDVHIVWLLCMTICILSPQSINCSRIYNFYLWAFYEIRNVNYAMNENFFLKKKDFIYLFIRERERSRLHSGSLIQDSIQDLRITPQLKAVLNH